MRHKTKLENSLHIYNQNCAAVNANFQQNFRFQKVFTMCFQLAVQHSTESNQLSVLCVSTTFHQVAESQKYLHQRDSV